MHIFTQYHGSLRVSGCVNPEQLAGGWPSITVLPGTAWC